MIARVSTRVQAWDISSEGIHGESSTKGMERILDLHPSRKGTTGAATIAQGEPVTATATLSSSILEHQWAEALSTVHSAGMVLGYSLERAGAIMDIDL